MMDLSSQSLLRTAVLNWRVRSQVEKIVPANALSLLLDEVEHRMLHHNGGCISEFEDPALKQCWDDDLSLGWAYQFWISLDKDELETRAAAKAQAAVDVDKMDTNKDGKATLEELNTFVKQHLTNNNRTKITEQQQTLKQFFETLRGTPQGQREKKACTISH